MFLEKEFLEQLIRRMAKLSVTRLFFGRNLRGRAPPPPPHTHTHPTPLNTPLHINPKKAGGSI